MNYTPLGMRVAACAAAFALLGPLALAGSPRVTSVYPSGGQRGVEVEITCSGSNLEDAKGAMFDQPGFEVTAGAAEKGKFKIKVKVPQDARLGEHTFRVITATGVGDLRLFYVSPFPMVEEQEPPKTEPQDKVQPVALGTTVYGRTEGEDQDRYEVQAAKGQRISAEVVGARLQTQNIYDPMVVISKADGTLLSEVDDVTFSRQDPVASIVAPEDGKYIVTIKEATNSGPGPCHYLLHIGAFARPLAVYPAGGPAGETLKVQLIGDSAGALDHSVQLPDQPDERFEVVAKQDPPAPSPNIIRVSPFPNVLEAEPNNDTAGATAAGQELPLAFNGLIEKKGDFDYFKFTAKKDQAYEVAVFGRALRSPIDSVLSLYDAKGKRIQQNDDDGRPDSRIRWTAPADGDFYLSIKDQLDRGGPLFTYRVEVTPVKPSLAIWLPDMVPNSSQERRAIVIPKGNRYASLVRIKRSDVAGDVDLKPLDLPAGVKVHAAAIDKSVDTIPMVFEVGDDATPVSGTFKMEALLKEPAKDSPAVPSSVQHDVDVAENGNQKAFYSVREDRLPVAIIDDVPLKLALEEVKAPILQQGSLNLKVKAERKGDFKGAITLSLLYAPPGIGSPGTVTLKEGESEATLTISANDKAVLQKWKVCVVGSADFGKGPVFVSTQLADLEVAAPFVAGKIQRTFVDQGGTTEVTVKLEQKIPFEGKATIALTGLPSGCTAEEKQISKDDTEVKFTVKAEAKASPGQHRQLFCQFKMEKDGQEMNSSFAQGGVLRVDKATVASN